MAVDPQNYGQAIGFEQITVDATAGGKGFTVTEYSNVDVSGTGLPKLSANVAKCTLEGTAGTNDIRYTEDGTAPTTTVGHLAAAGATSTSSTFFVRGRSNIAKFRAIRVGGTSGTLTVTFYVN